MKGHNHEGLCSYNESFRVFLTKKAAEKAAKKKLNNFDEYFQIVEVEIPV